MHSYEVEVKSLLGSKERAEEVRKAMRKADPGCALISRNKQLNHYFVDGSLKTLVAKISPHLLPELAAKLRNLAGRASEFSIRSRQKDDAVLLVLKVSVGDDTSANGISRIEFEEKVPVTLAELDTLVLSAGFKYQAKWSREREEYVCRGVNITLDKNAGYGWLAEFERVVNDKNQLANAEKQVRALMQELGVEELSQDRLERMFAFYNSHWREYYGTDNIFVIE